jgi:hypothetical protein
MSTEEEEEEEEFKERGSIVSFVFVVCPRSYGK